MRRSPGARRYPRWARSFAVPSFRLLWIGLLLQAASLGMQMVVTGWLVFEITGSPFWTAVSSAMSMAPFFFLGPVSGAVADRLNRVRLLLAISAAAVLVTGAMAAVLLGGAAPLWAILALTAFAGGVTAFQTTTRQALTYDLVGPALALNGMSLNSVSFQIGLAVGSLLSGFIIAAAGAGGQFLVICLLYLGSGAVLALIRSRPATALDTRPPSILRVLRGYLAIMRRSRTLVTLMALMALTELFGFTHMSLLPVIAKDVLGLGAVGLGVMSAVRQAGGIAALLVLAALGDFRHKGRLLFAVMIGFGASLMALVVSANVVWAVAVLTAATACAMAVDALSMTLMQDNVANEERGRAMGAWTLSIGVAPVGQLGIGALASAIGAPQALFISGAVLLAASAAAGVGLPRIRRLA
ncbi:MAG: MFS transporter [Spirochaetaceae bacterium]|nr:MFS transporter [Spirochaetaceae bacterium]